VREAVERTLAEPGAAVVVSARSKLAYQGMELRLEGEVDFGTDRCRLDGPAGAVVCDGPVQFSQLADGRWARQGEPGRWSNVHPRWGLELLAHCTSTVRETSPGRFAVDFDPVRAAAITHAGMAPEWAAGGSADLDDAGRVRHIGVRLEAPDAALDWAIDFADFGPPAPIALPPETAVVELAAHVAELRELGDQPPGA
jgi:hypothetical protein